MIRFLKKEFTPQEKASQLFNINRDKVLKIANIHIREYRFGYRYDKRSNLNKALSSYKAAIDNYEIALGKNPSEKLAKLILRKKDGLVSQCNFIKNRKVLLDKL